MTSAIRRARSSSGFQKLARLGFATKGLVYIILGVLAVLQAVGQGGQTQGSRATMQTIAQQPFGQVLLWIVAIGLVGYAVWRLASAILGPGGDTSGAKATAKRLGFLGSGLVHLGLAFTAGQMAMGSAGGGGGQTWIGQLMQVSYGPYLVAALGVAIIIGGLAQFERAVKAKFADEVHGPPQTRDWVVKLGRVGFVARGIVFPIIGFFLVKAGLTANPDRYRGIGGALQTLSQESYGAILLGVVAAGLVAYGAFMVACAKYREVRT